MRRVCRVSLHETVDAGIATHFDEAYHVDKQPGCGARHKSHVENVRAFWDLRDKRSQGVLEKFEAPDLRRAKLRLNADPLGIIKSCATHRAAKRLHSFRGMVQCAGRRAGRPSGLIRRRFLRHVFTHQPWLVPVPA